MTRAKASSTFLLAAALAFSPALVCGQESTTQSAAHRDAHAAKQDMKDAGHDTANATRNAGHATKNETKHAYHKTKRGTKRTYHRTKNATKGAVEGGREGAHNPQ